MKDSEIVFVVGETPYVEVVMSRFILGTADVIQTSICWNSLKLSADIKSVSEKSPQVKLTPVMLTKLRDACEMHKGFAMKLFKTELTGVPECLVKDGNPYHNQKSQLLDIISPQESTCLTLSHLYLK